MIVSTNVYPVNTLAQSNYSASSTDLGPNNLDRYCVVTIFQVKSYQKRASYPFLTILQKLR